MNIVGIIREINYLISLANTIRAENVGEKDAWSFAFTNRSFLVPFFGAVLSICVMIDAPFMAPVVGFLESVGPEALSDNLVLVITLLTASWGGLERMLGKTRAIWNMTQAKKALVEAYAVMNTDKDTLTKALAQATSR